MTDRHKSEQNSEIPLICDFITDQIVKNNTVLNPLRIQMIESLIPTDSKFLPKPRSSLIYSRKRALQDEKILEEEHMQGNS